MKTLYIVLWRGSFEDDKWACDGIYDNPRLAELRLEMEEIQRPNWKHVMVTVQVPVEEVAHA